MVTPKTDVSTMEKAIPAEVSPYLDSPPTNGSVHSPPGFLIRWNNRIERLAGLEARGIARVMPDERHKATTFGYVQMAVLWFSVNITANNLILGLLGPLVFQLSFLDAALCSVFGAMLGSVPTAYMSIWGAQSGHRTMIVARYFMGYYPGKICVLLNMVVMVGFCMIGCVIGGQTLSAVADGEMSIVVGIVVVALITWVVATFGMAVFHVYERWAWLPQLIILFVLVGCAGPKFDTTFESQGDAITLTANRLSFFSLSLSAPLSWATAASDYYVYYPENTAKWKTFTMTFIGLTLSFAFVNLLGVGLASGIPTNPAWSDAYSISSGALILAGFNGLGGFGKFCGVIITLGITANNIPGTYSAALGFQILGRYLERIPRWFLTCVIVVIYTVCALAGRDHLLAVLQNFLALMGYWIMFFVSIVLEEHVLFKWGSTFDWTAWGDWRRLPVGLAALTAFLAGWAGAVVSMNQAYYAGPIAKMVGSNGIDLGIWVGSGFTLIVYPPLRYLELKVIGR